MIKIKDEKTQNEIISFLKEMRERQNEFDETGDICYTKLGLYTALKKKIFFKNLLLHPQVLFVEPFYKHKKIIGEDELEILLKDVIEYELVNDETFLTVEERNKVIKTHKNLIKKREKNGTF